MSPSEPPKYYRLSQEIESRISSGEWANGRMPSLRELAQHHNVSVVTASRAIQILRDKGIIGRMDNSGCYLATAGKPRHVGSVWGLCLRVTPGSWHQLANAISRDGFDQVMAKGTDRFLEVFQLDEKVTVEQLGKQVRNARGAGVQGIFFQPSRSSEELLRQDEIFLAACAAEKMPVVLFERNLRGRYRVLEHDLIAVDDFDGGVRCTQHLFETGRSRVAVVIASPTSSHEGRVAGYLHALQTALASGKYPKLDGTPRVIEMPADLTGKAADRWLADHVQQLKCDGLFCFQDSLAVGVMMELLVRGVNIPRDLAVVGYENLPIGNIFTTGVTTYSYPAEAMVRAGIHVMRMRIADPSLPPLKVLLRGELIVRESSNPA